MLAAACERLTTSHEVRRYGMWNAVVRRFCGFDDLGGYGYAQPRCEAGIATK
jgi:hypothetical protein